MFVVPHCHVIVDIAEKHVISVTRVAVLPGAIARVVDIVDA